MAKIIKFSLNMPDGTEARTIEELRAHFDLVTVLSYYSNGRLVKWLEARYCDDEAKKIAELSPSSEELGKQICDILGVECLEDTSVNVGDIFKKNDKREQIKKFTSDDKVLENTDRVAFTQEELDALIHNGIKDIYLCGERFTLPTNVPDITYIGVNMPTVEFEGASFEERIHIKGVKPDIEKYLDKNCELWGIKDFNFENKNVANFIDFFNSDLRSDIKTFKIVSPKAQCVIGLCYLYGRMSDEDLDEAAEWFSKAVEQDYVVARVFLGRCYRDMGDSDDEDYNNKMQEKELKLYHKAAEQGYAPAQYFLGCHHDIYDDDKQEAEKWYRMAAEQGYAEAQYKLGEFYYWNYDKRDYQETVKWFRKAAEQGHLSAQTGLGACYYDGYGVERNYQEAVKWFRKAAEKGDAAAQCSLGKCYYDGNGVEQNIQEAVKWFRKAAEQSSLVAQYELGHCYYYGDGVEEDKQEGLKWIRMAAEEYYPEAKNFLKANNLE